MPAIPIAAAVRPAAAYDLPASDSASVYSERATGTATPAISAHVAALQRQFVAAGAMDGFELLNPLTDRNHARFLAYRGPKAAALHAVLASANVITDVRGDVLRIGFGLYHDRADVDASLMRLTAL